jgi:hypothetical protein
MEKIVFVLCGLWGFAQVMGVDRFFGVGLGWDGENRQRQGQRRNAGVSPLRRAIRPRGSGRDDDFYTLIEMMIFTLG